MTNVRLANEWECYIDNYNTSAKHECYNFDITRPMSLLIVLSTDFMKYILYTFFWKRKRLIPMIATLYPLMKFVATTYPPALFVTFIQPEIGLKNLYSITSFISINLFDEGAHVEPRECYIDNYKTVVITTGG